MAAIYCCSAAIEARMPSGSLLSLPRDVPLFTDIDLDAVFIPDIPTELYRESVRQSEHDSEKAGSEIGETDRSAGRITTVGSGAWRVGKDGVRGAIDKFYKDSARIDYGFLESSDW